MIKPGTAVGPFGKLIEDEEAYRNNPAITNSSINQFRASERAYYHTFVTGEYKSVDTPSKVFGRAFHCYILEPTQFILRYAVWLGDRRAGKEWESFKEENASRQILTADEMATITDMGKAIQENKRAAGMVQECETEVVFRHMCGTNLARQCRVDGLSPFSIIDLKTTDNLDDFKYSFKKYGYHRQSLWYSELVKAVLGGNREFHFIAVEKKAPYAVGVFKSSDEYNEIAYDEISDAIRRLDRCLSNGQWSSSDKWRRDDPEIQTLRPWRPAGAA